MELPLKYVSGKCEVHTAIYFYRAENFSASAIRKQLQDVYGVNVMPERTVNLWEQIPMCCLNAL